MLSLNFNIKIGMTLSEYYINRNVKIIKRVKELQNNTKEQVPVILNKVAIEFDVSPFTIKAVFYDKSYAYAKEAWDMFNQNKTN